MLETHRRLLRQALHKNLMLDLEDRLRAEAVRAHAMVRDHSGLRDKRAREAEGQARFRMMEQGFEDVCALHGGRRLEGGIVPGTELKVFQPFARFEIEGQGIILGLAAIPDAKVIPIKNKSRLAGVSINYALSPRLDLDGSGPKHGDIFASLLVARSKARAGLIDEIAVGVIDSGYVSFLFYEPLATFLAGVSKGPEAEPPPAAPTPRQTAVKVKKDVAPFVPPEAPARKDPDNKSG